VANATENEILFNELGAGTWVGYSDVAVDQTWVWEDGTTGTYTNWATDQPDNGTDADCAMFDTNGQWEDYDCTENNFYACKYATVEAATAGG